jgi:hypothetical protein
VGAKKPKASVRKREPSPSEATAIREAGERHLKRSKPPRVSFKAARTEGVIKVAIEPPHSDRKGWTDRVMDALGTGSADFTNAEVGRIVSALQPEHGVPTEDQLNSVLAVVHGVRPRDELEAMLASQMAVTHALAMDMLGRTKQSPTVPYMQTCAGIATKLQRTFVAQVEALSKLRRGGEQKVTVEHVHVHAGGQAIVGAVTTSPGPGGGGEHSKSRSQAHAKAITHASEPPLWCEDEKREALSVASGEGEDPV